MYKARQGAVYKIKCCDCQATYIGETGRLNLNARLTEHRRATRNSDINNNIAEHHLHTTTAMSNVVNLETDHNWP